MRVLALLGLSLLLAGCLTWFLPKRSFPVMLNVQGHSCGETLMALKLSLHLEKAGPYALALKDDEGFLAPGEVAEELPLASGEGPAGTSELTVLVDKAQAAGLIRRARAAKRRLFVVVVRAAQGSLATGSELCLAD